MSNVFFPKLTGLSWSVHETPTNSVFVSQHVSGRTVRRPLFAVPLYAFDLSYNALSASTTAVGSLAAQEMQAILGFYNARQGPYDSFYFKTSDVTHDPHDSQAVNQLLGIGNSSNTNFTAVRTVGSWTEPVGALETSGLVVSVGGALKTYGTDYSVIAPNVIQLNTAPGSGVSVTASYTFYFVCRFADDTLDFENFSYQLWSLKTVKLITVKP